MDNILVVVDEDHKVLNIFWKFQNCLFHSDKWFSRCSFLQIQNLKSYHQWIIWRKKKEPEMKITTVPSKTKSFETRIVYIQTVPIRLSIECYSNIYQIIFSVASYRYLALTKSKRWPKWNPRNCDDFENFSRKIAY